MKEIKSEANSSTKRKLELLDYLRVISAIFVFVFHSNTNFGVHYWVFDLFASQSALFMVAFFMLSGFSLFYTYREEDFTSIQKIGAFYRKRLYSIYPLYIACYVLYLIFLNTMSLKKNIAIAPMEILGLQSFVPGAFSLSHNGGTWFISCILFCYFAFPFLKLIASKAIRSRKYLLASCYLASAYMPVMADKLGLPILYSNPFFRVLEFLIGMLLAAQYLERRTNRWRSASAFLVLMAAISLVLGVSLLAKFTDITFITSGFFTIPIFALVIYRLAIQCDEKKRPKKPVEYLSGLAYAFYLAQFFTWKLAGNLIDSYFPAFKYSNIGKFLICFAVCSLLAVALHEIVEKPARSVLSRLETRITSNGRQGSPIH